MCCAGGELDTLESSGFPVDANTLYPLLRRMEKQGLLTSGWNTEESRPRKYYVVSAFGNEVRVELAREWAELGEHIQAVLGGAAS